MRKLNLPIFLILFLCVAIMAASTFEVVAYMKRKSEPIQNEFIPANVSCQVNENFQSNIKTSITVQNTGNIDAYIRLRVVSYWQDSKGDVVGRSSPEILFGKGWSYNTEKWIYNEADQTFYYTEPVSAGQSTAELLTLNESFNGIKLAKKVEIVDNITYTYHPVIEFIAEAIQSQPIGEVTVEKWGMTLDANGKITNSK